jgi:hypothetical protein
LKSSVVLGFGAVRESRFVIWLSGELEAEDFGALEVGRVITSASEELGIDPETARRYLIKHTAAAAEFKSDGALVTLSDGSDRTSQKKASAP